MKNPIKPALYAGSALLALALAAAPAAADDHFFGADIKTAEAAVEATSLAEKWLNGEIPSDVNVTYDGPVINYRYASYLPAVAGLEKLMDRALKVLEKDTNGKIKYQSFHSQSLHPQREAFNAVRDGIADYSACFMIYEPTSFDMLHGLTLPFLFDDSSAATRIAMELYPTYFKEEYENMGVYIGREFVTPPYNMIGNSKYLRLEDWQGSKVRLAGRTQVAALKRLGGVPVSIPSGEAYTSLQRGLVDTVAMNDPALMIFKLQEISKFHNQVALFSVNLEYCVSQDWFDGLPDDLKQVYYHWNQKTNLMLAQLFYERVGRRAESVFVKAGVEPVKPTAAEIQRWQAAVAPVTEEWVAETEGKGLPAKAMLADIEKMKATYGPQPWNEQFQAILDAPIKGLIDF
ncbi:MAG: TRAP transporter substrate-binding protein DctP [Alphaproteobacteria bacterium]|nr:TRAP transporter substrate-binding protein DctP [Alphaproteobacteria bacterium]